jgi:hypothetical protein
MNATQYLLSAAEQARVFDEAKARAQALRGAAISDALDRLVHGSRRAWRALAGRAMDTLRSDRAHRQLEA